MSENLPSRAGKFAEDTPAVWKAYQDLGRACAEEGPLDGRSRRLVKLMLGCRLDNRQWSVPFRCYGS